MIDVIVALVSGVLLGTGASRVLFLGWWTLVPWGIGGVALGFAFTRRATLVGAIYGFVLCFTFMFAGYNGTPPAISHTPFFALIGLVGAICGAVLGLVGAMLRRMTSRPTTSPPNAA